MEFKSFRSIEHIFGPCTIWEKIDGSNSQICIYEENGEIKVRSGSRNKWVTPDDDNFGFARWVEENKQDLIQLFGIGRFFGEWTGGKIQRKYGLKEKIFVLFNHEHVEGKTLHPDIRLCPILFRGEYYEGLVKDVMDKLKAGGSYLVPGFMDPEGIVIRFDRNGAVFKRVFKEQFVPKVKVKKEFKEIDPEVIKSFLQEERLNSVLSKDENYIKNFPSTLTDLCRAYADDLIKESFEPIDEEVMKRVKQKLYPWVKDSISKTQCEK